MIAARGLITYFIRKFLSCEPFHVLIINKSVLSHILLCYTRPSLYGEEQNIVDGSGQYSLWCLVQLFVAVGMLAYWKAQLP